MGSRRRRRRSNEISRYNLNEYVRKRVEAIENNPFAFSYSTPTASYRGRYVEKVEDSYASLASYAYRGDSVVAACMRVRRDLFRQAKFCWREIDEAGPGKIFRTDELDLLDNPWPNGTTGELLARMITDTDLCGNSFIHHDGDRLRWLRPDWVSIVLSGDPQADPDIDVLGYVYTPGGLDPDKNGVAYSPDDICHWAPEQDPLAFYRGMSWVSKALEEVQGDRAATTHKVAFFRNGATLGPIVRVPAGTSMQQFKEFMAAAEEAHAGAHNAYKTMYLGGGADVTLAAADFRQLDLKSVQGGMETRIAAVAGVHPVLVGLSEGLAGSSLNSGNFAAARRATAEMTLYSLWQDACGALQAFFKVPDQAELWIRERDIPFLREEARDRAEIFKTQVLAIEAAMRAGFKPDPAVKATLEERLDLLIGNHTGLFSVQMQPPQSGMPGAPPLDVDGDGQPDEPGTPIDFGALRADLWIYDDDEIERALLDAYDLEDDELDRARYDVRVPAGFEGGGRFRKLSDRLVSLLSDWAKGEGPDDPLDDFSRDQLRRVTKELADKATAAGDHERAARLIPRRGASSDEIKLALYKDVRAHVRGERDRKAEPGRAKFTLQGLGEPDLPGTREKTVSGGVLDEGERGRLRGFVDSLPADKHRKVYSDSTGSRRVLDPNRPNSPRQLGKKVVEAETAGDFRAYRNAASALTHELAARRTDESYDGDEYDRLMHWWVRSAERIDERFSARLAAQPKPSRLRGVDVAVYRDPQGRPALYRENDAGKRGALVKRFDSLDDMAQWADEHGETRLAEWAHKEAGGKGAAEAKAPVRSVADVAAAIRRMGDEDEIAAEIRDVRATDVRALADELNLTLPPAAKSATARKRYIAQTMAAHHRRTGGRFEHIGPLGRTTAEEDRVITDALEEGRDAREALREFRARRGASSAADAPHPREQAARDRQAHDRPGADIAGGDPGALSKDEMLTLSVLSKKGTFAEGGWVRPADLPPDQRRHLAGLAEKGWLQKDGDNYRIDPRGFGARQGPTESGALVGDVVPAVKPAESTLALAKVNHGAIVEGHVGKDGTFTNEATPGSRPVRVVVQRIDPLDQHGQPITRPLVVGGVGGLGHFRFSDEKPQARIIGHDADTGRRIESAVVPANSRWSWHMNPSDDTSADIEGEIAPERASLPGGAPAANEGLADVLAKLRRGDSPGGTINKALRNGEIDETTAHELAGASSESTARLNAAIDRIADRHGLARPEAPGGAPRGEGVPGPAPAKKAPGRAAARVTDPFSGTPARKERLRNMLATVDRGEYPGRGLRDVEDLGALKSSGLIEEHASSPHGWRLTDRGRAALAPSTAAPTADLPDASDPEALRDALDLRTADELKTMLRERGLPVSGRKRELVDRLVDAPTGALVAKTAGAKARAADNSAIVGALRGGGSEGEYIRALAADPSLTSTRLRAVAADLGINVPDGMRAKTALQLHIASEAARKFGPGDGSLVDRMPTPGASKAFDAASMAERLTRLNDEGQDFSAELKGVTSIANARKLATALNISAPSTPHPTRKDFFGTAIKVPKKMTLAEWRKYIAEQLGRSALRSGPPEAEDLIRAGEVDVEDLEDEDYDDEPDLEDMQAVAAMDAEVERAAGHDVTPGHDELHHYWTRGEGLAKWADSPRPWTTLVAHLVKHVGERKARIFASRWFIEVFGFAAGSDMNRVTHGKPPRGQVVGPG